MKKGKEYPDVTLLFEEGTIMNTYEKRYLELGEDFYDLLKHDLKNFQSSSLIALDLYKLGEEEKYLDMIEETL